MASQVFIAHAEGDEDLARQLAGVLPDSDLDHTTNRRFLLPRLEHGRASHGATRSL